MPLRNKHLGADLMKGSISSLETRSDGDFINFDLDERTFSPEGTRVVSKQLAIDGTGLTTDWGYPYSNIVITASNFFLSKDDYDILIGMKEDETHSFLFHWLNKTYKIILQAASGTAEGNDKILINTLSMSIVSRFPDGETS
jgi:hypothetical protein